MLNINTAGLPTPIFNGGSISNFRNRYREWKKKSAVIEFCLDHFNEKEKIKVIDKGFFDDILEISSYNFDPNWYDSRGFNGKSKEEYEEITIIDRIKERYTVLAAIVYPRMYSKNILDNLNEFYRVCELINARQDLDRNYYKECKRINRDREILLRKEVEEIYIKTIKERNKTSVPGLYADYYIEPEEEKLSEDEMDSEDYYYKQYQIQEQPNFNTLEEYRQHKRKWLNLSKIEKFSAFDFSHNERRKRLKAIEKSEGKTLVKRTVYDNAFGNLSLITGLFMGIQTITSLPFLPALSITAISATGVFFFLNGSKDIR